MRSLLALLLALFLAQQSLSAQNRGKGLLWVGLGEADGIYEEEPYRLKEEVQGVTYEYNEQSTRLFKNLRSWIPSEQGRTDSFFVHWTTFDDSFTDDRFREHTISFTEIIPFWSRGFGYQINMGKKNAWLNIAELFLGVGLIGFEKTLDSYGQVYHFEYKYGFDVGYGWGLTSLWVYDDRLFVGWRSVLKNNRITLEYSEEYGYLTHRRDWFLIFGGTFQGSRPSCVSTQYVKCP